MNKQLIFDTGVRGVLAQGGQSMGLGGACLYRGPKGTKCALGHSISDAKYVNEMEAHVPEWASCADPISRRLCKVLGAENEEDVQFLRRFQNTHDMSADEKDFLERFRENAKSFAVEHGLDASVLA